VALVCWFLWMYVQHTVKLPKVNSVWSVGSSPFQANPMGNLFTKAASGHLEVATTRYPLEQLLSELLRSQNGTDSMPERASASSG
jgi:hypothetical protein